MASNRFAVALATLGVAASVHAPPAAADTPHFPGFAGYTPAAVSDYAVDTTTPGIPSTGTFFLTPDGVLCTLGYQPPGAACSGNNLPAISPAPAWGTNSIDTTWGLRATNDSLGQNGRVHGNAVKTLPPFHTITVDGVTCGVDDADTTACRDASGRGFVLSPAGSGWLPHV